jgi:hypothetical protein
MDKLIDVRDSEGNYVLGNQVYDRQGNHIGEINIAYGFRHDKKPVSVEVTKIKKYSFMYFVINTIAASLIFGVICAILSMINALVK